MLTPQFVNKLCLRTDLYYFMTDLSHDKLPKCKNVYNDNCSQHIELYNDIKFGKIRPPEVYYVLGFIRCSRMEPCAAALTLR